MRKMTTCDFYDNRISPLTHKRLFEMFTNINLDMSHVREGVKNNESI